MTSSTSKNDATAANSVVVVVATSNAKDNDTIKKREDLTSLGSDDSGKFLPFFRCNVFLPESLKFSYIALLCLVLSFLYLCEGKYLQSAGKETKIAECDKSVTEK